MVKRLSIVLIVALPVCLILVRWPVVFAVVGGGLCCAALIVVAVQVAMSGTRYQPTVHRASATVDGVPVRDVEVIR